MERDIVARLEHTKEASNDVYTKVACILEKNGRLVSYGYNRCARQMNEPMPWTDRPVKNDLVIHAEMDAVSKYKKEFDTAYVSLFPCLDCAKLLVSFGMRNLYYVDMRLNENAQKTLAFLSLCGVTVNKIRVDI